MLEAMPGSLFFWFSLLCVASACPEASPPLVPDLGIDAGATAASVRETIDLLELDLSAMIRDVAQAAEAVHSGTSASAQALAAIRSRGETLVGQSQDARRDSGQVASATTELAQSA